MIMTLRWMGPLRVMGMVLLGVAFLSHQSRAETAAQLIVQLPDGTEIELSNADLAAMPQHEYRTSTVWTEDTDRYTGVLLLDLLRQFDIDPGAQPGQVQVSAIDGYSATVAFDQITYQAPMLAFLQNGNPMPRRRQGPFWLLFPYDSDPVFRTESIYAQSVWQVRQLTIDRP